MHFLPVKVRHCEDMSAIWKLDEPRVFFILSTKAKLRNWNASVCHAHSTNAFLFAHQTTANMVAGQNFLAGLIASGSVTYLVASFEALIMLTFPRTRFTTWHTLLTALFVAFTVDTAVFTIAGTRWAWRGTGLFTHMRTNQHGPAPRVTSLVQSTISTLAAPPRARVTTFQSGLTRHWAICWCGRAGNGDFVSTWPITSPHQLLTFSCTWLFAIVLADVATRQSLTTS